MAQAGTNMLNYQSDFYSFFSERWATCFCLVSFCSFSSWEGHSWLTRGLLLLDKSSACTHTTSFVPSFGSLNLGFICLYPSHWQVLVSFHPALFWTIFNYSLYSILLSPFCLKKEKEYSKNLCTYGNWRKLSKFPLAQCHDGQSLLSVARYSTVTSPLPLNTQPPSQGGAIFHPVLQR